MRFAKSYYSYIVTVALALSVLVIALDRWDAAARHLGIPSPREVVQVVREQVAGSEPVFAFFNPEIRSSVGEAGIVATGRPLPPDCEESARLAGELISEPAIALPSDWPILPADPPRIFVRPDTSQTFGDLTVGPSAQRHTAIFLTFTMENAGVEGSVVLDNIEIETVQAEPLDASSVAVTAVWSRQGKAWPVPGSILGLDLAARFPEESEQWAATVLETGSEELNIELKEGEKIHVSIQVPIEEPGLYALRVSVYAFDAQRVRFEQHGPVFNFGWTNLSSGPFERKVLDPRHSPACEG